MRPVRLLGRSLDGPARYSTGTPSENRTHETFFPISAPLMGLLVVRATEPRGADPGLQRCVHGADLRSVDSGAADREQ